jgi:SAM-dependent methyltransferase
MTLLDGSLYDRIGTTYARVRRPDPRIAQAIHRALDSARSVLNVGAGAGSYEPLDRLVTAVEPSAQMRRQRPPGAAPCIDAVAQDLPFSDGAFDAGLAILTVHHWTDPAQGLCEMMRVCRRIVMFTWDPERSPSFWMTARYLPEAIEFDRRCPSIDWLRDVMGPIEVSPVPIAHDCTDGFYGAYWRRPYAYLKPEVRAGISVTSQLAPTIVARAVEHLRVDLESGAWEREVGRFLPDDKLDLGYRLVTVDLHR